MTEVGYTALSPNLITSRNIFASIYVDYAKRAWEMCSYVNGITLIIMSIMWRTGGLWVEQSKSHTLDIGHAHPGLGPQLPDFQLRTLTWQS